MQTKIYTLFSIFTFLFFIGKNLTAQDTFSIIAVDPETGEVGAAGATCVDGIANWGGIQLLNKIIPGKGGVNAQAWICLNPHINLDNAMNQMENGLSPEEIIEWLQNNDACSSQNFNPEYRQYGIADFDEDGNPRVAGFTGSQADDYKNHILGENYAIQGNILLGPEILEGMENGFNSSNGALAEKLMAAMQGANVPGADARCLDRGTSATTAFLRVVRPDDTFGDHYLELSILEMPFGGEPIDSLQTLYDEWFASTNTSEGAENQQLAKVFPNPASQTLTLEWLSDGVTGHTIFINDIAGKRLHQQDLQRGQNPINLPKGKNKQVLFLHVKNEAGAIVFAEKILVDSE